MVYERKENHFLIEVDDYSFTGDRSDPFGFWQLKGKKGKQKIDFDSTYTSADDAVKAVHRRIRDLGVRA